jgi:hypothetical protein
MILKRRLSGFGKHSQAVYVLLHLCCYVPRLALCKAYCSSCSSANSKQQLQQPKSSRHKLHSSQTSSHLAAAPALSFTKQ